MRQLLFMLMLLLAASGSSYSVAVMVTDLYQAEVAVDDQAPHNRKTGIRQALQQVLLKTSGQSSVLNNKRIRRQVDKASERYVKSFGYRRDDENNALWLQVIFAADLVDALLRDHSEPIWGKSRPLILVWQASESKQRERLPPNTGIWVEALQQAMTRRGLPVLWPSLDLQDEQGLPQEKLWGLFQQDIRHASERYQADAILAGRVSPQLSGDGWQYRGVLLHQQQSLALDAQGTDPDAVLNQIVAQVAEYFASLYAVKNDRSTQFSGHQIEVDGIHSFAAYHQLLTYLAAHVAINRVDVLRVDQSRITLSLDLAADWSQVWRVLALDKRLRRGADTNLLHWEP